MAGHRMQELTLGRRRLAFVAHLEEAVVEAVLGDGAFLARVLHCDAPV